MDDLRALLYFVLLVWGVFVIVGAVFFALIGIGNPRVE